MSYLCTRFWNKAINFKVDPLAQSVEHIPFKDGVLGSNPKRVTQGRGGSRKKAVSPIR